MRTTLPYNDMWQKCWDSSKLTKFCSTCLKFFKLWLCPQERLSFIFCCNTQENLLVLDISSSGWQKLRVSRKKILTINLLDCQGWMRTSQSWEEWQSNSSKKPSTSSTESKKRSFMKSITSMSKSLQYLEKWVPRCWLLIKKTSSEQKLRKSSLRNQHTSPSTPTIRSSLSMKSQEHPCKVQQSALFF